MISIEMWIWMKCDKMNEKCVLKKALEDIGNLYCRFWQVGFIMLVEGWMIEWYYWKDEVWSSNGDKVMSDICCIRLLCFAWMMNMVWMKYKDWRLEY